MQHSNNLLENFMSKTPNFDAKIKPILDALQPGQIINCPITKKDWALDDKEIEICRRFQVPPCPIEPFTRMKYLNGFSVGLTIFWKPHALTGQPILSAFHPDLPFKIINDKENLAADPTDYGFDYNSQVSFFDLMWRLETTFPFGATRNSNVDDSSLVVGCVKTRNCFIACGAMATNCFYVLTAINCEDSIDISNCERVTGSFSVGGSQHISDSVFIFESRSCLNSFFLFDCQECDSCFGAINRRHKKYLWFNEQLSESEYKKRLTETDLSDRRQFDECWKKFIKMVNEQAVWPAAHGFGNIDSTGERLYNCVRCQDCFFEHSSTDLYRCRFGVNLTDSFYASGSAEAANYYMVTGGLYGSSLKFSSGCYSSNDLEYCIDCKDCEYCFGCVNLRRKKYCILNHQYTPDEYWRLVDQIKCDMLERGEYGQFWPAKMSLAGFQQSVGDLFIHYSHEDLEKFGALIVDPTHGQVFAPQVDTSNAKSAEEIPNDLLSAEPFVGVPIYDKAAGRYYSVLKAEYDVYKNKKWPFPTEHYATRLFRLLDFSYGPISEERACASCGQMTTTYNNRAFPDRRIYCQDCYLKFLEENN